MNTAAMSSARTEAAVDEVLGTQALIKRFPGIVALKGVNFSLRRGEIHSLCGENGAGKSTLIKTLSGTYPHGSYEGHITMGGVEQRFTSIRDAEAAGLGVIHQELALVPEMTVAENIFLGHEPTRFGLVDHDRMYKDSTELLQQFGIVLPANALIQDLGVGQKQLVEIAKALHRRSRILILDEPTAALTEQEVAVLLAIIQDLAKRGVACVYISHKLDEVFAISHRITVLRDGETIVTLNAAETDRNAVVAHMVGRPIENLFPRRRSEPGEVLLEVEGLSVAEMRGAAPRLHGVSFQLRRGEVLGIGGLMGAGRSETLMHLFGVWGHRLAGTAKLLGQPLATAPQACIEQGLVLVTDDRKRYGLVLEQTVAFNLSLSALGTFSTLGYVDQGSELRESQGYVKALRIKIANMEVAVNTLSGGNQQKVVIGKALMTKPQVVFLDEPTRGIDVGAKLEIYELINELTAKGMAVVLVSSELPELIGMSDRIVMLAEGRVGGVFDHPPFEQKALMHAAMRVGPAASAEPQAPRAKSDSSEDA
jgi:D-xylose transport system ATP-binding protein